MLIMLLALFLVTMFLGTPIAFSMSFASIVTNLTHGASSLMLTAQQCYDSTSNLSLLTRYGLPTAIDCDEAALRRCVGHDKKTAGGTVQLVIVRCMGQGELVTVPLSDLWEDKA